MAVGSLDQIAAYMTDTYWVDFKGSTPGYFLQTNISVNYATLSAEDQAFASIALELWGGIAGLTFTTTTGSADITFADTVDSATSISSVTGGLITSSNINIGLDWNGGVTTDLYSIRFQAFLHEIGHSLGLGHSGPYNSSATYPADAAFDNDSWQVSVMSYFTQDTNTTVTGSYTFVLTPQIADIIAIQDLYSVGNVRAGDTIYGDGNSTGLAVYGTGLSNTPSVTIYDSGGTDLMNYSDSIWDQVINLTAESLSSVYGFINNIIIARGTLIENATGGLANDIITGNAVSNTLIGGAGVDILNGMGGNDRLVLQTALEQGDAFNGGTGFDRLDLTARSGNFIVNLATGVLSWSPPLFPGNQVFATVSGIEVVDGGSGNDTLVGDGFGNFLQGMGGNDTLVYAQATTSGSNVDWLDGGTGTDTFVISNEALGARLVDLSTGFFKDGSAIRATLISIENVRVAGDHRVIGDAGVNVITGTSATGVNTFSGGGGDDRLYGGGGGDTLNGDAGADILNGENGNDLLGGGSGNDQLFGGDGDDTLNGDGDDDRLTGGDGNDVLNGGAGQDVLIYAEATSGLGNVDQFDGGDGVDLFLLSNAALGALTVNLSLGRLYDGATVVGVLQNLENVSVAGAQRVIGNAGANVITGLSGSAANDFSGGFGADTLYGGGGNDTLKGGDGNDQLFGGEGDDYLVYSESFFSGTNIDTFDGGAGTDTFVLANFGLGAATVDLAQGILFDGALQRGTLTDIENVQVAGSQNVIGDTQDNVIANILSGTNVFSGGGGNDTLLGGGGNDTLNGDAGKDTLKGEFGDDLLNGGLGNDVLNGGSGDDTLSGQEGRDKLLGGSGNDILNGGAARDRLKGNGGRDILNGGEGRDLLKGGGGKDILQGGLGNDRLAGGGGRDIFLFNLGDGADQILGFVDDIDTIKLDSALWGGGLSRAQVVDTFATLTAPGEIQLDFGNGTDSITIFGLNSTLDLINDIAIV